jgi:lysyl-tRNA synthetase class 1
MHWADFAASRLAQRGDSHIIATGITPSGHIHVGNMREVLTGDKIGRAHV